MEVASPTPIQQSQKVKISYLTLENKKLVPIRVEDPLLVIFRRCTMRVAMPVANSTKSIKN